MKMIVIASVLAGTLALSQNTYANPQPSHQGAHMQVEEWINSLRGLSLNSTQKAQMPERYPHISCLSLLTYREQTLKKESLLTLLFILLV